ncbi:MAG: hypothetical protein HYR72_04610 [Deltaproteobacteria bacterium]|nr:hypothetical protein [Deltaproteobacteria bacterium]MBI3389898.1 hypothetical protein [Deltaproteobacteria bacterium]
MLAAKTEQVLATVTERLRALFSARLVTVALYGSAVGPDFVAGQSDLNLVVVLDTVGFADLQALQAEFSGWRKQGLATPLLLDQRFLRDAADVFPMELEDIAIIIARSTERMCLPHSRSGATTCAISVSTRRAASCCASAACTWKSAATAAPCSD